MADSKTVFNDAMKSQNSRYELLKAAIAEGRWDDETASTKLVEGWISAKTDDNSAIPMSDEKELWNLLASVMYYGLRENKKQAFEFVQAFVANKTIPPATLCVQIGNFDVWRNEDLAFIYAALLLYRKTGKILQARWPVI